ncbi:MAG: DUF4834 family protein [Bacteroidaceae bacterium]|nr:DUF4834 family protein [Bacteroidaceae bacterium]
MALFYIIIFIGLFIILSAFGLLGVILRFFFGGFGGGSSSKQPGEKKNRWYTHGTKREKVFKDTDGEYVDFEEVKDPHKE